MERKLVTYCLTSYNIKKNPKYAKLFNGTGTVIDLLLAEGPVEKIKIPINEKTKTPVPFEKEEKKKKKIKERKIMNNGVGLFKTREKQENIFKDKKDMNRPSKKYSTPVKLPNLENNHKVARRFSILRESTPKLIQSPVSKSRKLFGNKKMRSKFLRFNVEAVKEEVSLMGKKKNKFHPAIQKMEDDLKMKRKKRDQRAYPQRRSPEKKGKKSVAKRVVKTLKKYREGKIKLSKEDVKHLKRMKFMIDLDILK